MRMEDEGWIKWIGGHFSAKALRNPESEEKDEWRIKRWPQIKGSQLQRLAKLLSLGAGLDASSSHGKDIINGWLRDAWKVLTVDARVLTNDGNQYALDRHKMDFSLLEKAYVCPVTNKLIDSTFKGFTLIFHVRSKTLNNIFVLKFHIHTFGNTTLANSIMKRV
ncbi:DEAD-box helicase-related protein [Vibrio sp. JCM 19052]|nr:DEAD-box helicase-related protein [Vibrio sp. JCM 19052]